MKKHIFAAFLLSFALGLFCWQITPALSAQGGFTGGSAGGGFTGPGPALTTVEQAKNLRDDTKVTLRGAIVQHLGGDKYLFKDGSGAIHVDIDDDEWMGQSVGPDDTVELYGKVDKDWNSVEIDVKRLTKK